LSPGRRCRRAQQKLTPPPFVFVRRIELHPEPHAVVIGAGRQVMNPSAMAGTVGVTEPSGLLAAAPLSSSTAIRIMQLYNHCTGSQRRKGNTARVSKGRIAHHRTHTDDLQSGT
jgi:hypothetical protein